MSDETDNTPSNVFQFPGSTPAAREAEPVWQAGAFIDQHGPAIFLPVAGLTDGAMAAMLYDLKQHRALANMLIDLMETEIEHRGRK